jgi:hypothetical protein
MAPTADRSIHKLLAAALLAFPCLFMLVLLMHFRRLGDFLDFRWRYVQPPPDRMVAALIDAHNQWPMTHDPHVIGYLALPVIPLCAFALYVLGSAARPMASAIALTTTITGTIYMGGVFGMWTAFFRGLGLVDRANLAGATATFAALTAPQGAFLMTTTLAKLTMIGLAAQALTLIGTRVAPVWSIVCVVVGCALYLAFWDLNNWMLIGTVLIMAGFAPMRKALLDD